MQIYTEKLTDLLSPQNKIRLREKQGKFVVYNLSDQKVVDAEMGCDLVSKCEMNRNIGSTSLNPYSSRSHAIYMFKVLHRSRGTLSNLYFIDLAGSERLKKSKIQNEKYNETISINTSLTTLGKCIIALTQKKKAHVPFRESKLTKVLMETLSGNSKVAFIVNLSAKLSDIGEGPG